MPDPPDLPDRYAHLDPPQHFSGGYGDLWVVMDQFLDRAVVYKRIQDEAHADQIVDEVRMLSAARSRHVVDIYDVMVDSDAAPTGFVMEYLSGDEFGSFRHDPADTECADVLGALYQVACGLRDLHALGVVHRDLKPDNFRNNSSGVLKLFDFGISVDSVDYVTRQNRGTVYYAAPELYIPGATIDFPMDIYAFAVCAWQLATGSVPPELRKFPPTESQSAQRLDAILPGVGHEFAKLIVDCLAEDPAARPTATVLVSILERALIRGRHVGVFSYGLKELDRVDASKPEASIGVKDVGNLSVRYDGSDFRQTAVSGEVWINNRIAAVSEVLPLSCVISFGAQSDGGKRQHVSFASSRPGVLA